MWVFTTYCIISGCAASAVEALDYLLGSDHYDSDGSDDLSGGSVKSGGSQHDGSDGSVKSEGSQNEGPDESVKPGGSQVDDSDGSVRSGGSQDEELDESVKPGGSQHDDGDGSDKSGGSQDADSIHSDGPVGPKVAKALKALADKHEVDSQDDMCVIGPMHPSGEPKGMSEYDLDHTDIRVMPHCVMGDSWEAGFVDAPPPNEQNWEYNISLDNSVMVQTYALDILALATQGRMTPLRLWHLAMKQKDRFDGLKGVDYGEMKDISWTQEPEPVPGLKHAPLLELEKVKDIEEVKQRLVHEGRFWVWMAPDRFPISPTKLDDPDPHLLEVPSRANRSMIEALSPEVLIHIVSSLPLTSLLNLATTSRSLHTSILGNDYLASVWMYNSAPFWVPVQTQTPKKEGQDKPPTTEPPTYLASQWSAEIEMSMKFPSGLGWGYIRRCARSGSKRNRRRIWNTALDIERAADQEGMCFRMGGGSATSWQN